MHTPCGSACVSGVPNDRSPAICAWQSGRRQRQQDAGRWESPHRFAEPDDAVPLADAAEDACGRTKRNLVGDVARLTWGMHQRRGTRGGWPAKREDSPSSCIRHGHAGSYNRLQAATCRRSFSEAAVTQADAQRHQTDQDASSRAARQATLRYHDVPSLVSDRADRRTPQLVGCTSVGWHLSPVRPAPPRE